MHLVCMNARLVYAREVCAQLKREARIKIIPNFIQLSRGKEQLYTDRCMWLSLDSKSGVRH